MIDDDVLSGMDHRIEEDEDEPGAPRRPSISEQRRMMAGAGDVRGLLQVMESAKPGDIDFREFGKLLCTALDVLSRSNPKAFAELLHTEMLATVGRLVLRAEFQLEQHLARDLDRKHRSNFWDNNPDLDAIAAKIMALHLHAARIQQLEANTQRLLEQARKQRLANDKVEARRKRPRRPSRRQRVSESRPQPSTASRLGEGLP